MTPVRQAAIKGLEGIRGAFLRCDRGEALYVTNAPSRSDRKIDWEKMGFTVRSEGGLSFLVPHMVWVDEFSAWARKRIRQMRLTAAVGNVCYGDVSEEDMKLWIEGLKRLEMKGDAADYEKLVRQRAAVCLREGRGAGALEACALIVDLMNEGGNCIED